MVHMRNGSKKSKIIQVHLLAILRFHGTVLLVMDGFVARIVVMAHCSIKFLTILCEEFKLSYVLRYQRPRDKFHWVKQWEEANFGHF